MNFLARICDIFHWITYVSLWIYAYYYYYIFYSILHHYACIPFVIIGPCLVIAWYVVIVWLGASCHWRSRCKVRFFQCLANGHWTKHLSKIATHNMREINFLKCLPQLTRKFWNYVKNQWVVCIVIDEV